MFEFSFPTWAEFSTKNNEYLAQNKYNGYKIMKSCIFNLYLSIDCQNESCLFPHADNVIRFAWCTSNGFAIYSKKYLYCEAGFLGGCADLINAAKNFSAFFKEFNLSTAGYMQDRFTLYELEHKD